MMVMGGVEADAHVHLPVPRDAVPHLGHDLDAPRSGGLDGHHVGSGNEVDTAVGESPGRVGGCAERLWYVADVHCMDERLDDRKGGGSGSRSGRGRGAAERLRAYRRPSTA